MIKKKLTTSDYIMILANLLPVLGVWYLKWSAYDVFLVYCLESIIIGGFTLLKMGMATLYQKKDWWSYNNNKSLVSGVWFMLFFMVHYGLFVGVQLTVFLGFTSFSNQNLPEIWQLFSHPSRYLGTDALIMLGTMVLGYSYDNLFGFIWRKEYKSKKLSILMFEPYMRVFIQQFTVILGSVVLGLGGGKVFILLFAVIKTFFTVFIRYSAMARMEIGEVNAQASKSSHS
jgi:hypothetical protein